MTFFRPEALEFARRHLSAFYDSDFFPKPPSYEALWTRWDDVKAHLLERNVGKHASKSPRMMPSAKADHGYRIVHQLHPLDAIVYTAIACEIADAVERARRPANVACSYRIQLHKGSFFGLGTGHNIYVQRCRELAQAHAYVLVADIGDFYNKVYVHRLQSAVAHCNSSLEPISKELEGFLLALNGKMSQGIPIGPAASIICAEVLCNDIDEYIDTHGYVHTRYVDDFRIFSDSDIKLRQLEEQLAGYLFEAHRLQLAWHKTSVMRSEDFVSKYLSDPDSMERMAAKQQVIALTVYPDRYTDEQFDAMAGLALSPDPPAPKTKKGLAAILVQTMHETDVQRRAAVRAAAFPEILGQAMSTSRVDLALARLVLRRCRNLNVQTLVMPVLNNLAKLAAVSPDVFLYLRHTVSEPSDEILASVRAALEAPALSYHRIVRYWLEWWVAQNASLLSDKAIRSYMLGHAAFENQARAAVTLRSLSWMRNAKSRFSELGLWERNATLWAVKEMPSEERRKWLQSLNLQDPTERWIGDWAREQ
jgi:hypothetical protein